MLSAANNTNASIEQNPENLIQNLGFIIQFILSNCQPIFKPVDIR